MSNTAKKLKLENRLTRSNTSHLLHLVLSIITAGIWIPVWILIALNNATERSRIIRKLDNLETTQ